MATATLRCPSPNTPDKAASLEAFFWKTYALSAPLDPGKAVIYVLACVALPSTWAVSPTFPPLVQNNLPCLV
jgi:hypothetical protein